MNKKKLLSKLERAKKTKEGLESVMKGSESSHAKVGPVLSRSIIQHAIDMNNWIPILEAAREYKHQDIKIPSIDSVLKKDYDQQLETLSTIVKAQNRDLDKILREHTEESKEVVSVAMGKLKKRERTAKEIEDGGESSSEGEPEPEHEPEKMKKSTAEKSRKHKK